MTTPTSRDAGFSSISQQASWWPTHEFLAAVLVQVNTGPLPIAGTPSWCALAGDDPNKLLALAVAGHADKGRR